MKRNNKKGFTLAELLIVVAIIAVLVAIAIPVFSGQLEKARKAADEANCRNAYAEAAVAYLDESWDGTSAKTITVSGVSYSATIDSSDKITVTATSGLTSKAYNKGISYTDGEFTALS